MLFTNGLMSPYFKKVPNRNSAALNIRFKQEITRLFYKQAPFVSSSLFLVLGVFYYFFKGIIPDDILTVWVGVNLLFSVSLLLTYIAYRRHASEFHTDLWLKAYVILMVLQDLSLGMLGPMSTLITDETSRLFILFLLAGMAAGAIATRAILFKVYLLSISALLLPIALTYSIMDYSLAGAILGLTLVFYVFMLFVGKNYSDSISTNIHLWLNLEQEIEARKQTEKDLLQAKQSAEIANETKNQFLASVSHELRTPLNGIIGFSSALKKSQLSEQQALYAKHIGSCSNTLLHMVNDVLDITTIESGHLELRDYPFNLSQEMDEVVALAQRLSEDKGLTFEYRIAPEVPQHFIGDGQRVKQVINNLVSNAIKYTEQGTITLDITAVSTNAESALIQFAVEDSGIGIPASAHATLFDSFTQASTFDNKRHDGVGLGLSIVNNLLQQMHGEINFESEEVPLLDQDFELPE